MKTTTKWLLLIIAITLFLRLPTLFEPHWFFDEGIYATVGSQWFEGAKLYKEIWDHKPPGIFVIYGLSYLAEKVSGIDIIFWAKLAAGLAVASTQIALYKISLLLFTNNIPKNINSSKPNNALGQVSADKFELPNTLIAPALYGLLSSLPFWEGYMANAEIFMLAFSVWGIFKIQNSRPPRFARAKTGAAKLKIQNCLLGGILVSLAILIKPVAIAEAFLGFLILLLRQAENRGKLKTLLAYSAGLIGPIILACLYFLAQGTFPDFVQANLIHNLKYASNNSIPFEQELIINSIRLISILLVIYFVWKKRRNIPSNIVFPWLILSTIAATLSLRPYIHYLIQLFPPLCLLITLSISKLGTVHNFVSLKEQFSLQLLTFNFALLTILIPLNQKLNLTNTIPYQFDQFSYYQNFLRYTFGYKTKTEYVNFFGHGVEKNLEIVKSVEKLTQGYLINELASLRGRSGLPNRQLFIWAGGEAPWLYYDLSKLGYQPSSRYANHYHAESTLDGINETIMKLEKEPATLVIIFPNTPEFEELKKLITERYKMAEQIEGVRIYKAK
ncbi:MAG: hypothetical protein KJ718_01945 [Nanoarchaeota archaeon]|nr:hypothetical protein [Nanoarchaeota archaeon]